MATVNMFESMVGWYCCLFVGVMVLLHGNITFADDSLLCYSVPPHSVNTSTDHSELFFYNTSVKGLDVLDIELIDTRLNISGDCGIVLFAEYRSKFAILPSAWLNCSYSARKQTPLPRSTIRISNYVALSHASVTLEFDHLVASDGALRLSCYFGFPKEAALLSSFPTISFDVFLQLQGCPHAKYGVTCNKACSCAVGVECHPFSGKCICPRGLEGTKCNNPLPSFTTGPSVVYVRYGEYVDLSCSSYGMTPSQFSWERGGVRLERNISKEYVPYHPRPFHLTTTITATGPEVNGTYICSVTNNHVSYSKRIKVIVTAIPDPFLEAPSNQTITLGDRAEFHCRTKPEAGTLTWMGGSYTNDQQQMDRNMSNQTSGLTENNLEARLHDPHSYWITRGGPGNISIVTDDVRFQDAGMYQCLVGHHGANDSAMKQAWLTVQSQGSTPDIKATLMKEVYEDTLMVYEHDTVTLECNVYEVYPQPNITWLILGHQEKKRTMRGLIQSRTSQNGVSLDVNSALSLTATWKDDGANITCSSNIPSFQPAASAAVHLKVAYSPKVSVSPIEITVQPGDSPTFNCNAEAKPQATEYHWLIRGKDGQIIKNYSNADRSVTVENVKPSHNLATLTCRVTNDVGTNQNKSVLKVFDHTDNHDQLKLTILISTVSILAVLTIALPAVVFNYRKKIQSMYFVRRPQHQELKKHDVFVAYKANGKEEEFVLDILVPKLKEWGCDVCIDYENFIPGTGINENIKAAISNSRKTILVLSTGFMASEWCYYEFLQAMDEMLRNQTELIIPLMFEDIRCQSELCQSMTTLLNTVSYIPCIAQGGRGQSDEFLTLLEKAVQTRYNVNRVREDVGNEDMPDNVNLVPQID